MRRIILSLIVGQLFAISAFGQLEPVSGMFWNSLSYFNPANSGLDYSQFYSVQARDQWTNINKNPFSTWAIGDVKLEKINSGIGINYLYDQLGTFRINTFNLNYNYQIRIGENHVVSPGISFGLRRMTIKGQDFIYNDPNDPAIPMETVHASEPMLRFGLIYKFKNLKTGVSILNVNKAEYTFKYGSNQKTTIPTYLHYYFFASYRLSLEENFELNPNVFYQQLEQPVFETDKGIWQFNLSGIIASKYIIGLSYRTGKGFIEYGFNVGIDFFEKLRLTYMYDSYDNDYIDENYPSHEAAIIYFIE